MGIVARLIFVTIVMSSVTTGDACNFEKGEDYQDFATRSDVILLVTPISVEKDDVRARYEAKFKVLGHFSTKSGGFQMDDVISLEEVDQKFSCALHLVGGRYFIFIARKGNKKSGFSYSLTYKPVPFTDKTMKILDDVMKEDSYVKNQIFGGWNVNLLRKRRELKKVNQEPRKKVKVTKTNKKKPQNKLNPTKTTNRPTRSRQGGSKILNKWRTTPPMPTKRQKSKNSFPVGKKVRKPNTSARRGRLSKNIPTKQPSHKKPAAFLARPANDEEPTNPPRQRGFRPNQRPRGGATRPPRERASATPRRRPNGRPRRTTTVRSRRPGARGTRRPNRRPGRRPVTRRPVTRRPVTRRPLRNRRSTTPATTTTPTTTTTTTTTTTSTTTITTTTTEATTTTTATTPPPRPVAPRVVQTSIVTRPGTNRPLLALGQSLFGCPTFNGLVKIFSSWQGRFHGMVKFPGLSQGVQGGWMLRVTFNMPLLTLNTYTVDVLPCGPTKQQFCLVPKEYAENIASGTDLVVSFNAEKMHKRPIRSVAGEAQLLGICQSPGNEGRRFRDLIPSIPDNGNIDEKTGQAGNNEEVSGRQGSTASTIPNILPFTVIVTSPTDSRCRPLANNGKPAEKYGQTKPQWEKLEGADVDYNEILHKSILFYEAQRSGELPEDNRIPWRGDSDLQDGCPIRRNLTGGWYNSGGNTKTTSLIAFSTTMLAWGAIDYSDAYEAAGELANVQKQLRWAADYLIKCHVAKNELVVQIGDYTSASRDWSRPEESMSRSRVVYKADKLNPAGDAAAETAAALAAVSMLFESIEPEYSAECLNHAKELYAFAKEHPEHYNYNSKNRAFWYSSRHGSRDEMAWAAAWLNKATGDKKYLTEAEDIYNMIVYNEASRYLFSWNQKANGIAVLLAGQSSRSVKYVRSLQQFLTWTQNVARRTPQGLVYLSFRYPTMFAANSAFISLKAVGVVRSSQLSRNATRFARQQMKLLIGSEGQSYVVGVGKTSPRRPHHRGSTCPGLPQICNKSVIYQNRPNANTLYGALVAGPTRTGRFTDRASNYINSNVRIDFNAAFQSLAAGLLDLELRTTG